MADALDDVARSPNEEFETIPEQYRDLPSIGQRIGSTTPVSVQPTPDSAQVKDAQTQNPPPRIQFDAAKLPMGILPSTAKVDAPMPKYGQPDAPNVTLPQAQMPAGILRSRPTLSQIPSPAASSPVNATLPGLMQQRSQAATPLDPKAQMYRMGWGQRLAGTAANFLNGFAKDGAAPIYTGPGATNSRFARDTAMQGQKVANLDTDIGNQEKLATEQQKVYEDATKQAYEGEIGEARNATAKAQQDAADARQQAADAATIRANKAPDKTLNPSDQRANDADKYGLKGSARRDFILTGKLPKDMLGSTRQPTEFEEWKAAFVRDNKRQPTADEISNRKASGSKGDFDKIERDKQNTLRQAELRYRKAILDVDPKDADGIKAAKDQLEQDKTQAQADYEDRIREKGGTISSPGQATVSAPPPNKVAPARGVSPAVPRTPPKAGDTITVDSKPFLVTGFNPKTKKPIGHYVNP